MVANAPSRSVLGRPRNRTCTRSSAPTRPPREGPPSPAVGGLAHVQASDEACQVHIERDQLVVLNLGAGASTPAAPGSGSMLSGPDSYEVRCCLTLLSPRHSGSDRTPHAALCAVREPLPEESSGGGLFSGRRGAGVGVRDGLGCQKPRDVGV